MNPKFTSGEWEAEEHMFGGRSSQIIDGFYDADNNIILGANEYAVWLVKESDIRLIELAPLLAEHYYLSQRSSPLVVGCQHEGEDASLSLCSDCKEQMVADRIVLSNLKIYLDSEIAKLYEEGES